ncbi:hypothetical protein HDV57DRAFT_471509 [Trichoderma longibrachiatum]
MACKVHSMPAAVHSAEALSLGFHRKRAHCSVNEGQNPILRLVAACQSDKSIYCCADNEQSSDGIVLASSQAAVRVSRYTSLSGHAEKQTAPVPLREMVPSPWSLSNRLWLDHSWPPIKCGTLAHVDCQPCKGSKQHLLNGMIPNSAGPASDDSDPARFIRTTSSRIKQRGAPPNKLLAPSPSHGVPAGGSTWLLALTSARPPVSCIMAA